MNRCFAYAPLLALWIALQAIVYAPLFRQDPLLNRDDLDLIEPLKQVSGLGSYFSGIAEGRIFDVAPVRDLTFKANLLAAGIPVLGGFHFWNSVIWSLCALLVFLILRAKNFSPTAVYASILLLACHPAMVNTVSWVSARKHLLAAFFILVATAAVVTGRPRRHRTAWITFCYFLAVFSQPIVLLWPLWWLLFLRTEEKKSWREALLSIAPLTPILAVAAAVNAWYYSGPYLKASSGFPKFVSLQVVFDPRYSALSLGRHYWQLIAPLWVSPLDYDIDSIRNPLGMFLLAAVVFLGFRSRWRKEFTLWLAPFFLALGVVVARPTFIFVSDTYLVWPILASTVLLAVLLDSGNFGKWIARGLLAVAVPAAVSYDVPLARAWLSTSAAVEYAYRTEPSEKTMYLRTVELLHRRDWGAALDVAYRNLDNQTIGRGVFAEVVLEHPGIPLGEKENILKRYYAPSITYVYRLAAVYAQEGKFDLAYTTLLPFGPGLGRRDPYALPGFNDYATIAAELLFFCRRSAKPAAECGVVETNLRKQLAESGPEALAGFEARLKSLAIPRP